MAYQVLNLLQTRHIAIIVKRGETLFSTASWKNEDEEFDQSIHWNDIEILTQSIGKQGPKQINNLALLAPIVPKRVEDFDLSSTARANMEAEIEKQRKQIQDIKDPEKRARALHYLNEAQDKYLLGIYLQDHLFNYNPSPVTQFSNVFVETWQTIKALILGYLNPKWISGPIGIVQVIHHGWTIGTREALFWIAAISLNVGMLNLLPLPVLDGGYICLALWEAITKRRLKARTIEKIIISFVVLLIGLLIFLTFQDITRLF